MPLTWQKSHSLIEACSIRFDRIRMPSKSPSICSTKQSIFNAALRSRTWLDQLVVNSKRFVRRS